MESVPAKRPLRTLADFKGVKMRVPEGLGAEIWRRAGAGVVTLPGSEVYTALERGVIEATDWGTLGMNNDLGYHKIARFPLHPGFHSMPAAEVAVNMTRWNALSPDLKVFMEMAVRDFAREMVQRIALEDLKAVEQARAQNVELVELDAGGAEAVPAGRAAGLGRLGEEEPDRAEGLRQPGRVPEEAATARLGALPPRGRALRGGSASRRPPMPRPLDRRSPVPVDR